MLLIIMWRVWSLARSLRRGSYPGFLDRGFCVYGDDARLPWRTRPLSRRVLSQRRSVDAAMRIMLGPLYEPRLAWLVACLGAFPVVLLAPWLGVRWFIIRSQRLATLLYEPHGEIVELALLPGLGNVRQQRHALLMQALIRPLIYGGLCLAGAIAAVWAAQPRAHASPEAILNVLVPPVVLLLLFASLTLGVASGRLAPGSTWLRRPLWMVMVLLPVLYSSGSVAQMPEDPVGFLLFWILGEGRVLLVLVGMAAFVIYDAVRLRRHARLLCQ